VIVTILETCMIELCLIVGMCFGFASGFYNN